MYAYSFRVGVDARIKQPTVRVVPVDRPAVRQAGVHPAVQGAQRGLGLAGSRDAVREIRLMAPGFAEER